MTILELRPKILAFQKEIEEFTKLVREENPNIKSNAILNTFLFYKLAELSDKIETMKDKPDKQIPNVKQPIGQIRENI